MPKLNYSTLARAEAEAAELDYDLAVAHEAAEAKRAKAAHKEARRLDRSRSPLAKRATMLATKRSIAEARRSWTTAEAEAD